MKLFYAPGACSLVPHILLREAGLDFEMERTDLRSKQTATGADFLAINPKGYVPALQLKGGEVLTEVQIISQYIGDQAPQTGLVPPAGSLERYRALEWLGFIATEVHKTFGPMFKPNTPAEYKAICKENLARRFDYIGEHLAGRDYLLGDRLTLPDAYLFVVLGWAAIFDIDLGRWPAIAGFMTRMRERPAVRAALEAEGLPAGK